MTPKVRSRDLRQMNHPYTAPRDCLGPSLYLGLLCLAGAAIGGFASFSTSWGTQRAQIRPHSEAERARLEALYSEFITESGRLVADARSHQKDDIADMVGLYTLVGRMRLVSSLDVVAAAEQIIVGIPGACARPEHRDRPCRRHHPSGG